MNDTTHTCTCGEAGSHVIAESHTAKGAEPSSFLVSLWSDGTLTVSHMHWYLAQRLPMSSARRLLALVDGLTLAELRTEIATERHRVRLERARSRKRRE